METFIRMVQPCILRKIVIPYANFKQIKLRIKIDHRLKFSKYLDLERRLKKVSFKSNLHVRAMNARVLSGHGLTWNDSVAVRAALQVLAKHKLKATAVF